MPLRASSALVVGLAMLAAPGLAFGMCHLSSEKQPQEEGGSAHHQNLSPTASFEFLFGTVSQTLGIWPSKSWLWLSAGDYFTENQSDFT